GSALAANLSLPRDSAPTPDGGFYISDYGNFRIRRVSPGGIITTFAGNGNFALSPDSTPGTSVQLGQPYGLSFDPAGNLLITELGLARVRRRAPDGTVVTVAGTGRTSSNVRNGIPATQASLFSPTDAAGDSAGNIYIADTAHSQIRKVDPTGIISAYAGGGSSQGDGVAATSVLIGQPQAVAVTPDGVVYFAEVGTAHRVRRVGKDGIITTVAGTSASGFNGDGPATESQLNNPRCLALDAAGNLYICDAFNNRVRKVTTDGRIVTILGNGATGGPTLGAQATATPFGLPTAVAVDAAGNVFAASATRVFRVSTNGTVTLTAGTFNATPFAGDGGPATSANLNFPFGLAVDTAGNLFIADSSNNRVRVVLATPPSFQVAPATLSFTAPAGGSATSAQTLALSTTAAGGPFTVTSNLPAWLTVSPMTGTLPSSLQVVATPGTLAVGTYNHTVTINAPNAVPATRTVNVTFTVTSAAPPSLLVTDTDISFAFGAQSTASARNIAISNSGGGSLAFTAVAATTSGGTWLSVTPAAGTATPGNPVLLGVRANPGTLGPGVYLGTVTVTSAATNQRAVIAVTMTINAQRQSIQLSQSGLTFTAVAQSGFVLPQSFSVLNTGQGVMNWTVAPFTLSGGPWLAVSPASGSTDASSNVVPTVQVSVNASTLGAGTYYGRVVVSASAADNSPQMISVVLNVLPAGTNPGPQVQPAALIFTGAVGSNAPSSQNILLGNPAGRSLAYVSGRLTLDGADWFFVAPPTGSVPTDQAATIVVQPVIDNLTAGVRRGVLTLLFTDGSIRNVSILLVLTAGGAGSSATTDDFASRTAGCTPTKLLPLVSSVLQDFNIPAAWPTAVTAKVVDDCGNLMTSGSVTASFSNGDPPLSLFSLKDGNWSATWQPRNSTVTQTSINVTAQIPEQNLQGSISISGSLQKNPDPPQVSAGGVVSGASFGQVGVLAPGSFISIFGTRFADGLNIAPSFPWLTELVGTEVILGGRSLPLYFTSTGQINAVVPKDVPPNSRQQLVVRRGFTYTVPESVSIAAAQPAIFTPSQTGKGQGYVLVSAAGVETLADSRNPAKAGDAVVVYCAGLGITNPAPADGSPASSTALSPTVNPVTITIGGKEINPFFGGLAPGFIGLYQVNAVVPSGIAPGDAVPVVLTVGGQSSPVVTMAVR
ncbi:MAG TPA: hypothetical protein VGP79_03755, partial [Bryobacteraceae bacterium]|nr:hypothetical protein [Bryobacteraceae bacterium]